MPVLITIIFQDLRKMINQTESLLLRAKTEAGVFWPKVMPQKKRQKSSLGSAESLSGEDEKEKSHQRSLGKRKT